MKHGIRAIVVLGIFTAVSSLAAGSAAAGVTANAGDKPISVNSDFKWNGIRNCDSPRPNFVLGGIAAAAVFVVVAVVALVRRRRRSA